MAKLSGLRLEHPVIVLGIPAYNEAEYLRAALDSLRKQSYPDFLAVIGDNASTDGTREICEEFVSADSRFRLVRHERNIGAAANFQFLRDQTRSEFFCWFGGHDLLEPHYLAHHLAALRRTPEATCSFSYLRFIDESGRWLRDEHDVGTHTRSRSALLRFLWSVGLGVDLGPIHGVFRRARMSMRPLHSCAAWDHVYLSNCIRDGIFVDMPGHLYTLRSFDEGKRDSTIMQRISGDRASQFDFSATISAYLADFDAMSADHPDDRRWRPLLEWILNDRFGPRRIRLTKWLRTAAKRLHSIRRLLGARSS